MIDNNNILPDRFWDKILLNMETGCWTWIGCRSKGYGMFHLNGRMRLAHKVCYSNLIGPVPDGLQLDHLCRKRECVNPDHLEPVTPRENTMRSPTAVAARHARATHCPKNHPYSGANLYVNPSGKRECRICISDRTRKWYRNSRRSN